jgi:hypothetical protein
MCNHADDYDHDHNHADDYQHDCVDCYHNEH